MISYIALVAYVALGIGTARHVVARTVANDVAEYMSRSGSTGSPRTVEDGIEWSWQNYGPLNVAMGFGAVAFWPLVAAWRLVLNPTGAVLGPMIVKWWHAPRERALRKAGLS